MLLRWWRLVMGYSHVAIDLSDDRWPRKIGGKMIHLRLLLKSTKLEIHVPAGLKRE